MIGQHQMTVLKAPIDVELNDTVICGVTALSGVAAHFVLDNTPYVQIRVYTLHVDDKLVRVKDVNRTILETDVLRELPY